MEGRWARLAVRAQTVGALDYRRVSADNLLSLAKEELVHRELERQLDYAGDIGFLLALQASPKTPEYLHEQSAKKLRSILSTLQPWVYSAQHEHGIPSVTSSPEAIKDYYERVVASARKARERKRQLEEEEANGGKD